LVSRSARDEMLVVMEAADEMISQLETITEAIDNDINSNYDGSGQ
jgi:hypothetical protein